MSFLILELHVNREVPELSTVVLHFIFLQFKGSPLDCSAADCEEETEDCIELKNKAVSGLAICLRRNLGNATRAINDSMPPRRARRCEELDCGQGFECLHGRRGRQQLVRCQRVARRMGRCFAHPDGDRRGNPDGDRTNRNATVDRPTGHPNRNATTDRPTPFLPTVGGPDLLLNLPDRCLERECCDNEICTTRRIFNNRPLTAVCIKVNDKM